MERSGVKLIENERNHQVRHCGYMAHHDDELDGGELAALAGAIALEPFDPEAGTEFVDQLFRGSREGLKAVFLKRRSRVEDLVVAGALIAAEIDRLLRRGAGDEALTPQAYMDGIHTGAIRVGRWCDDPATDSDKWGVHLVTAGYPMRRIESLALPPVESRGQAQLNLNLHARAKGWLKVPTCRVCGDVDERGQDGGCPWIEEDLCPLCVGLELKELPY